MTMLNRKIPGAKASCAFTCSEIAVLFQPAEKRGGKITMTLSLTDYTSQVARPGGYLARVNDPPPGNMVIWRGSTRRSDVVTGVSLGISNEICG